MTNSEIVVADEENKGLGDHPLQMRFSSRAAHPEGPTPKTGLVPVITPGRSTPF